MADLTDDYISSDCSCSGGDELSSRRAQASSSSSSCIVSVLASVLERTVRRNDRAANCCSPKTIHNNYRVFNVESVPEISIENYLQRILKHTNVGPSVFVVAYAYVDRFCEFHPEFRINSFNVHKILITTVMVASKFVEDLNYKNSYYAAVGGLEVWEINELEVEFLFMMKFKLQVSVSIFESYCSHVEREVAMGGGYDEIERTLKMVKVCGRGRARQNGEINPQQRIGVIK